MTISRLIRFLVRELGPCMLCGVAKKTKNTSPECIYMTDSLCCTLETNATLLISYVGVVQSSTHVWLFATPWTAARQDSLSLTISRSLPKFMFIASVVPSSHLILWCHLLLLPSIFPRTRDFSNEFSVHIRWPKYWSFSFNISPSSEYSRLISPTIDWFDLHAVQGTFRSLLQHYSSKASILWRSAFFTVQLSRDHLEDHSLDYTDLLSAE